MKLKRMCLIVGVLGLLLPSAPAALPQATIHSVTGTGLVAESDLTFRTTVAAFKNANGRVWGFKVINVDLTALGLGRLNLQAKVTCLHVNGSSAWVSAVVTNSNNEDLVPAGTLTITLVRDLGGESQDIMHTEFFEPSVNCASEPDVPETVVQSGNFHVR